MGSGPGWGACSRGAAAAKAESGAEAPQVGDGRRASRDCRSRGRNRQCLGLIIELGPSAQGSWNADLLCDGLFGVPFFHSRPGLCGLQSPRCGVAQQFLELGVELARIDVDGLGDRGPVALTNKTSEHASGCTAVDGNERRLDGVVQMSKVAGVLPRHVLFDELKQMRWDARARCDEQSSQHRDEENELPHRDPPARPRRTAPRSLPRSLGRHLHRASQPLARDPHKPRERRRHRSRTGGDHHAAPAPAPVGLRRRLCPSLPLNPAQAGAHIPHGRAGTP